MRIRELQKNNMSLLCNQAGFDFNCNYAANIYMYFVPLVEEGVKKGNFKTIFSVIIWYDRSNLPTETVKIQIH